MAEVAQRLFGGHTMVAPLRRVLVRSPDPGSLAAWREYGWRAAPDPARLLAEHEQFCVRLAEFGAEVIYGRTRVDADPDAIYAHDPNVLAGLAIALFALLEVRRLRRVSTPIPPLPPEVVTGAPTPGRM